MSSSFLSGASPPMRQKLTVDSVECPLKHGPACAFLDAAAPECGRGCGSGRKGPFLNLLFNPDFDDLVSYCRSFNRCAATQSRHMLPYSDQADLHLLTAERKSPSAPVVPETFCGFVVGRKSNMFTQGFAIRTQTLLHLSAPTSFAGRADMTFISQACPSTDARPSTSDAHTLHLDTRVHLASGAQTRCWTS